MSGQLASQPVSSSGAMLSPASVSTTLAVSPSASKSLSQRSESVQRPEPSTGKSPREAPSVDLPRLESTKEIHTLEEVPGRTTHSMGLAAEQDPHFLDAFRSVLLSDYGTDATFLQVYHGGPDPDDHPVHFMLLKDEFPPHRNQTKQIASDAIETLVWPHSPALIRLYFRHVHPALPIICKDRFLRQYATSKLDIPSSLRGAIYALASAFWQQDEALAGAPCPFEQHDLVSHAQISLIPELEAPNLYRLQACLLLMHTVPPEVDSVETPYTWIMASQATACAQMIGLHQDPEKWDIAPWERKLRKKLWWATFFNDCWSAVCHGNPPHISTDSFTTSPLNLDDLRSGEDIPEGLNHLVDDESMSFRVSDAARFLEMIKVSRQMRAILDCSCNVKTNMQTRAQLVAIRATLKDWSSLIPTCLVIGPHTRNSPLHLSFYAAQTLLFRGLMHPATKTARTTPGSNIQRWLPTALAEFGGFITLVNYITEEELIKFWGRHARSQFTLCGNFLIYLFLLASEQEDISVAYCLLEKFHISLKRLEATKDPAAKGLLRPVTLRMNSFLIQATELIKHGKIDVV